MNSFILPVFSFLIVCLAGCKKIPPETPGPDLVIKIVMDSTQLRLGSFGDTATVPAGNAAQHPRFNQISAHYIEMIPNQLTQLGDGELLYKGEETTLGGSNAAKFSEARVVSEGEEFLVMPLSDISAGNYQFIRVSVTYQNYDIDFRASGFDLTGTIASFVGFNNYIETLLIKTQTIPVNANKVQGFWAFEISNPVVSVTQGQAPVGATTVPNPIAATSPIPAGSCLVTGAFDTPLTITGDETEDIVLTLSFSTNNSFEWNDSTANGIFDPMDGDVPVDMGLRGLIGRWQ